VGLLWLGHVGGVLLGIVGGFGVGVGEGADRGVNTFYMCSFICLLWWKYEMELKEGFYWNHLSSCQVYPVFVLSRCGAVAFCVLLVQSVVVKFMANNKDA
jgi:hypothetical protein